MELDEYAIAYANFISELESEVDVFISDGFQPHGSLIIDSKCREAYYIQVMIKYKQKDMIEGAL